MLAHSKAQRTAFIGYAVAAAGVLLFTQLGRIAQLGDSLNVLTAVAISSFVATSLGFIIAIVASAIWAKRASARQPLKIAASIGFASFLFAGAVGVNVHGSCAILMFVVLFSVLNVFTLLVVTYW